MTEEQSRSCFAQARVLRLGTADRRGVPHLVPATFAMHGDSIAIAVDHKPKRHMNLKRLANIEENPAVTLLVDHFDEDWNELWWARADGVAEVLDNRLAQELVDALVNKYAQYRERRPAGPVIRIGVKRWSGWVARQE